MSDFIKKDDPKLFELADKEKKRIKNSINLIAAENYPPKSILDTAGSIFNIKTIEGYPDKRFHAGCAYADQIEKLAIARCKKLFDAQYANVQPHSGTSANLAIYFSVLNIGDKVLSMNLSHGGHLSHGHKASISSRCFNFRHYGVNPETELIDYDEAEKIAKEFMPKMIVAGASSYPRLIDYKRLSEIAKKVSAYLLTDMAHIAGLVAAKVISSPVFYSDFVTLTCYKTMVGGKGGVILAKEKYAKKIDSAVFPGCQGTSTGGEVAAKALAFKLAMGDEFKEIQQKTLENAVCFSDEFKKRGYRIVTDGTENHQVLIDMKSKGLDGNIAETLLESAGILVNRNVIPSDIKTYGSVSGVRTGTSAISARGLGKKEAVELTDIIDSILIGKNKKETADKAKEKVAVLCEKFPMYS